ncbi:maleate cis-trans isomerase family protein [Kribbella pratensis]|uniref:maleate cis-trans isomerase family protein n=1 Tax=Kribbella pratensis TaxID=2512112 RepID=UPI001065798A|nr:maleate cis-trans isomerase [Kribbella pratensis]
MKSGNLITVGVLTPHAAEGQRAEWRCMAATHVRIHVSRTQNPASPGSEPPTAVADLLAGTTPASLDEAVSTLQVAALDALVLASTSLGYALGHREESALVQRLSERWGLPACATAMSAVSALRALDIKRVSLIHPPWFGSSFNDLGAEYFRSQGFEVVEALIAELPNDPDRIEPASVVDWISDHLSPRAEAVVIGGNGFRAARAVHALESRIGRLVLEANQVLLRSVLDSAGAAITIDGFGRLLNNLPESTHTRNERYPCATSSCTCPCRWTGSWPATASTPAPRSRTPR